MLTIDNDNKPLDLAFRELPHVKVDDTPDNFFDSVNALFTTYEFPHILPSMLIKAERTSAFTNLLALDALLRQIGIIDAVSFGPGHINTAGMPEHIRKRYSEVSQPIDYQLSLDSLEQLYITFYTHYTAVVGLSSDTPVCNMLDEKFKAAVKEHPSFGVLFLTNIITHNGFCSYHAFQCLSELEKTLEALKKEENGNEVPNTHPYPQSKPMA